MVERLKSTLRQIHWSSLLKGAIFAFSWAFLPYWVFFLIALYLYFFPLNQSGKLTIPFLTLLLLTSFESQGLLFGVIFGGIFFYMLLIKDLLLIDRKSAYEVLVLALSFLLFRKFYLVAGGSFSGTALIYSLLIAILFGALSASFIACFDENKAGSQGLRRTVHWLMFLVIWQFLIVGLFLPLDFIYQTVIIFLMALLLLDLVPQYLLGEVERSKVLTASSVVFVLLVVVLGSARWSL